jgi:hypothetical protein
MSLTLPRRNRNCRRRGTLTLEWILLCTVLIIGTVGGLAAVRNALILEYRDMIDTVCEMSVGP